MIPATARPFDGIYPSTITPLRPDFALDEAMLARHTAEVALLPGIAGALCAGHAGENFHLSRAEKKRVIEVTAATIGASRIVVAGINAENSQAAAEHARDAKAAGADALMVFAPNSWAMTQDGEMAVRHHQAIIAAAGMPIFLFQASVNAGRMAYSAPVLERLVRLPGIVGIKEGSWETAAYEATRRMVKSVAPSVSVMASGDEHLLACYVLGSEGSLVSLADIIPETIVALDRAVRTSDLAQARRHHDIVYPLAKAIYGTPPGGHATARIKACLKLLGRIPCDATKPPIGPLPAEEIARLHAALAAAGLLPA
ncbi:MAG: dihydrodipicolinate synthase family protein [Alphaproteobacteria bacterium]|nr:dihydrodipicolinate synthase family protein [Alphaproteobacteria bacterium]